MAWVRFSIVLLALVALFLLPHMASAQPQLPCRFYGTVQLDSEPVPDDTVITATVDGDPYTTTTPSVYGSSTYAITIVPTPGMSYDDGTQVTFKMGNYTAEQTGSWETGGNIRLDLSASTPPPSTSTPTPSPTPSPTPTSTVSPTPTPPLTPTFGNPDFDTDSDWCCCGCTSPPTWHSSGGQGGAYYSYGYDFYFAQDVSLTADTPYRISWYSKNESGTGGPARFELQQLGSGAVITTIANADNTVAVGFGDNNVGYHSNSSDIPSWTQYWGIFETDTTATYRFRLLQNGGSGAKGFDTVFLGPAAVVPSPIPTPSPTPTLPPADTEAVTNAWNTVVIALCIGVLIICGMFAAYLIWKHRIRPGKAGKEAEGEKVEGEEAEMGMRWQDRLMLKMMTNRVVIKIFSTPIVLKVLMWEAKVFMSIISLFKRKKAEGEKPEERDEQ